MNVLDLFSGIGGFSLGLERAGMRTVAFCEIEPFNRKVLAKHWPNIPCYEDIRELTAARLAADGIVVDAICGGFPCQDISTAGSGAGIGGSRSGLWAEYARIIGELRPKFVIVENVAALLGRGLGRVLGDLAALGYDAEWEGILASFVGASHARDRIWIVAYPDCFRLEADGVFGILRQQTKNVWHDGYVAAIHRARNWRSELPNAAGAVGVVDAIPDAMDRIKALGNAVVPQIPEAIGRAILAAEASAR